MRKKLTKPEARFIALDYFRSFANEMRNTDSDFYNGILEGSLLDKTKLEKDRWKELVFNPTKNDKIIISREMEKLLIYFTEEMSKAKREYTKKGV